MEKKLIELALNHALDSKAEYSDVRFEDNESENINIKNESVEGLRSDHNVGFGIRILLDGSWGFSSSNDTGEASVIKTTDEAIRIARASSRVKVKSIKLSKNEAYKDRISNNAEIDPFAISVSEKIEMLKEATNRMNISPMIKIRKGGMHFYKQYKIFASTEGSYIEQERIDSGGGISVVAISDNDAQTRSYPNSFGGDYSTFGYEFVKNMDLIGNSQRLAEEALMLLKAKQCPDGIRDIIIDSNHLALQIHESIGHPSELDRVLGHEAAYAGMSFLTPEHLNKLKVGSDMVNIVSDATIIGALGGFRYDDEGVKAKKAYLVKNGIFSGYLNSRETAEEMGYEPMGAMRAQNWRRIPIIRMTSVNLEPGNSSLEELIKGIDDGLFISTTKSWSIDDKRLNFQFGTEIGWEIKNGKLGDMIKNPSYAGITPDFWNSCDGICNSNLWHVWGVPNCGKGEPQQIMKVSHGASPARFRKVRVGVAK